MASTLMLVLINPDQAILRVQVLCQIAEPTVAEFREVVELISMLDLLVDYGRIPSHFKNLYSHRL